MHWVIQGGNYEERGWRDLLSILDRTDTPHSLHDLVSGTDRIEPDTDVDGPVICMGSYALRHVARRKGWTPGVFDLEHHDYDACIRRWGTEMLNHGSTVFALKDIANVCQVPDDRFFFRPLADNKNFTGGVMSVAEVMALMDKAAAQNPGGTLRRLSPNTRIIRNEIEDIYAEYRTWVVDGRVVTASQYKLGRRVLYSSEVDDEVVGYAREAAETWQPDRAFVLDVAKTAKGMKIVEINTFNSAGFYAGDVYRIFEAVESMGFESLPGYR